MNLGAKAFRSLLFVFIFGALVSCQQAPVQDTDFGLDCGDLPGEYRVYADSAQGIAFCYPAGWIVGDTTDNSGYFSVSPTDFAMAAPVPDALVLIYPHEHVASLIDRPESAKDALGLAASFFLMIVQDGESEEDEPLTTVVDGQELSLISAQGTVDGEPVTGLLAGYKNGQALGMAISYLLQADEHRETAETIIKSVKVALPRTSLTSGAIPIMLDRFYHTPSPGSRPVHYRLKLESDIPILLVAHSSKRVEPGHNILDLQVYDSNDVLIDQFDTGWMGGNGARCDPDTMSDCVAYYNYGFLEPDAISFNTTDAGEYTIMATGEYGDQGIGYRLGAFDMRPEAPMVVDVLSQTVNGSEELDYVVDGLADQPLMAYVRATGPAADSVTLSLALLDATGEEIVERHNHSTSGDPVFLYWVPRDDSEYTVRLTEVDGQPASYELTVLRDGVAGRAELAQTVPAYANQYDVDISVRENGDLAVLETVTLTFFDEEIRDVKRTLPLTDISEISELAVSEGGQPYRESISGEDGTFQIVEEDGRLAIQWFFEEGVTAPYHFQIAYLVKEGVEKDNVETFVYGETKTGSTLAWQAIPPDRVFAVADAEVRVQMPHEVELHRVYATGGQGKATTPIEGFDFQPAKNDEVTFSISRDLEAETAMEIEVLFARPDSG